MQRHNLLIASAVVLGIVSQSGLTHAQITANEGDGVLNAPYRGTIDSLRECSADIGYGEVKSHVEPIVGGVFITSATIDIWVEGTWDRSVLRMYEGLDASNAEIDLTGTSAGSPETVFTDDVKRFSFKAIGTKTLAPQTFTVRFSYTLGGSPSTPTRTVTVAPITGSFCALPGESEAFILGTPILDVAVGNARLTLPVGRTAEMIGAAFIEKDDNLGPTGIDTNDLLLPGAAESAHIQNNDQFQLGSSQAAKTDWGTPWPGHLIGFQIASDPFGPDGTHYDSQTSLSSSFRRMDFIRPAMQSEFDPASVHYIYDDGFNNRVIEIRDQATTPNVITLTRTAGVVTSISTSDGRSWAIQTNTDGWISDIIPNGGNGKRSFTHNSAGRVTQVKDASGDVMYEFVYVNDASGMPTILTQERRFVDGALQTVVEHEIVSESLRRRKEFTGPSEFRQVDFAYDTANGLNHRLASMTSYGEVNTTGVPFTGGAGTPFTTTLTHDVANPDGSMVVTQVDLPDGTTINHEYDAHVGGQSVDFGFRTKSTRTGPNDGSLVPFDVIYEFFYTQSSTTRLYHRPRIVKQRDGRGVLSEVTFDYDDGGQFVDCCSDVRGQDLNRLLSITGPVINTGPSAPRTPQTRFIYNDGAFGPYLLIRRETDYASGMSRAIEFDYDELRRLTSTTVDPGGLDLVTQFLFCDTAATQDRITVDPDGYWTRTRFDNDGRVTTTERFLNVNAGNLADACENPTGPVYTTTNVYDTDGRLAQQTIENRDQDGNSLTPATITTTFGYDQLGRLTLQTVDPGGIGQESNFDYNWLGETERQFDTSGRGTSRTYDGRGLVASETPLAVDETPDTNLTTTFAYDAMGNLRFTNPPTGTVEERVYDDFDRVEQIMRIPGPDGGNTITTTLEYDAANNVTRTVIDEAAAVLSDTTALFDEGGFNYETRQRTVTGADNATDPLTQRKFDWAGNVIEDKSLGDATVADRVLTTEYDGADRVQRVADSQGGETIFTRDDRGNVTEQTVKIDGGNSAATTTVYDSLSRAIQITSPEDGAAGRPDRARQYDSRNNLVRETVRDAADVPKLTTVFGYDNAGRQTRQAVLADAASTILASAASVTTDRVTDSVFDADGRLMIRSTYNNNAATPLNTTTTYDDLGRVDRITDPSTSYTDEDYADNGRLSQRVVFDGVGVRTFTFAYDGHDRIKEQTAVGSPNLVTMFTLDGLDRQTRVTDPKGIATRTDFDLVGRRIRLVEDDGGALQRQTEFAYNRLSQLITQTAKNKTSTGTPLADQVTTYRYDGLGRQTRIVYPDSADHADPPNCTDCVRQTFDLAGRMTQRIDQRGLTTDFAYDDRGLLLTRTTGTDRDTLAYDAVGRITLADRGTTVDPDAVSHSVAAYTDLGDLEFETQLIVGATARTVDYTYDQAGNRKQLTYPGGEVLAYTPTALNQVDAVTLGGNPLVDYDYQGRLLDTRRTTTTAPGGTTVYEYDVGYDSHRRVNAIVNRFDTGGGGSQTVAGYGLSHDGNGNPLTQTVAEGLPAFVADDRAFTVDRLNRLTGTEYFENGQVESTAFDLVGNRESHTDRTGAVTAYGTVNGANEYPTIGGTAVTYDAAGNLAVDQAGRQYSYDEHNRLTQIKAADETVLANYTYDALGRRITFSDPVAAATTRYYYDGQSVIEERDATDVRVRFHVNGAQYIDERVATFAESSGDFTYYLGSNNFSVTGMGNADGSVIERLDYSSTGDFAGGGPGAGAYYHDADDDLDIDLLDFANFQNCFGQTTGACLAVHDFDTTDTSDGDIDLDDYARWFECFRGPFVTPDQACGMPLRAGAPPASGVFTLHGRPVDILSDGHAVLDFRSRLYDPVLGRWLQRDALGFADGPNLYESFRSNPARFVDAQGQQIQELINLILIGRFRSNEEVELALARGDLTFASVPSGLAHTTTNALEALIDPNALLNLPRGFEEGFRQPVIEVTTQRFEAFIFSQVEAGASLEEASSNLQLVALFGGDITGVTALGESVFGVELTTNEALTGSARVLRGVQGGSQIVIFVGGPQALRHARERSAALRAATVGVPSIAGTSAVRARVLANIAESQAARAASRFQSFAATERTLEFSRSLLRVQGAGPALTEGVSLTRFIRARELAEIQRASTAGGPAPLGRFFTPDPLLSARAGASQLSLGGLETNPVVAIIRVPASEFRGIPFRGASLVAPQFGQIGGGLEIEFFVRPTIRPESIFIIPVGAP